MERRRRSETGDDVAIDEVAGQRRFEKSGLLARRASIRWLWTLDCLLSNPQFHTTRWSVVLAAADRTRDSSHEALAELCQCYWFPVYAFIRRRVVDAHEAQDLTQEFFARLLEKDYLAKVQRGRGRFRAFLRTAVQRFLGKEWSRAKAQKRDGGRATLSLDFAWGESRLALEPGVNDDPGREFDRQWALQLLDVVESRLRNEYQAAGKQSLFKQLKPYLVGDDARASYEEVAADVNMTAGAVKTTVYRMRLRFRQLLRKEISQTVIAQDEVDDEVHRLFAALS